MLQRLEAESMRLQGKKIQRVGFTLTLRIGNYVKLSLLKAEAICDSELSIVVAQII